MPKTKLQKKAVLDELTSSLQQAKAMVVANYAKSTVVELSKLRDNLFPAGLKFTVVKTSLLKRALDDVGQSADDAIFTQPIGVTIDTRDEVQPNKLLFDFAKEHEHFEILGALVNGTWVDASAVKAYAKLPSREQLLGQVVGTIAAPLTGFMNVLQGNLRGLVSVLKQYQEQKASL